MAGAVYKKRSNHLEGLFVAASSFVVDVVVVVVVVVAVVLPRGNNLLRCYKRRNRSFGYAVVVVADDGGDYETIEIVGFVVSGTVVVAVVVENWMNCKLNDFRYKRAVED